MVQTKNIREISHTIESLLVLDCFFILQLLKIYNTLDPTKDASKREEASQFGSAEGTNIPRPVTVSGAKREPEPWMRTHLS